MNIYLTDLAHVPAVNEITAEYFSKPYPARAAVGVNSLSRGSHIEVDAVLVLDWGYGDEAELSFFRTVNASH